MLTAGTELGKYKILRLLGTGGMADVYEAEDLQLGRRVALKVLPPEFARDPKAVMRFEKEVRAAASLNHANIVTIFEVDHASDLHFCAMRLLTGGDLRARIDKGLSPAQALDILREITGAFVHAHGAGFVHRDAKAMSSDSKMTATGVSIGTPRYISPEQARGQTVDGRADIYSLGVIFYEMLTGKLPFLAEDSLALIFMHVTEPIPRLPAQFARFQGLVDALMAKEPAQRPATADDVLKMLRAFTDAVPQPPAPPPPPPRPTSSSSNATIVTSEREFAQKLAQEEERQKVEATRRSGQLSDEAVKAAVAAAPPEPPPPPPPPRPVPPPPPAAPPPAAPAPRAPSRVSTAPKPAAAATPSRALPNANFEKTPGSTKAPLAIIGGIGLIVVGVALGWMLLGGNNDNSAGDEAAATTEAAVDTANEDSAATAAPAATQAAAIVGTVKTAEPAPADEPTTAIVGALATPPAAATAVPLTAKEIEAEKKRKAAQEAKRSSAANKSKTAPVDDSSQKVVDRTKRFAQEKAGCKRHVSSLFPGWEFTYEDMAKYPGAKKSADGSIETPELMDDFGTPKRYIIDVGGCIVGVIG